MTDMTRKVHVVVMSLSYTVVTDGAGVMIGLLLEGVLALYGIRRRAEKLEINRGVENDLPTRSVYAHYSVKDLEFIVLLSE